MRATILIFLLICSFTGRAQFAPQATISGSTAIHKSAAQFTSWATTCSVQRGLMHIGDPSLGYVTGGDSLAPIGSPDGGILSLGDSGVAVLTFARPITDGPGPDFAVFENGFPNTADPEEAFLELAFVEVSSDGVRFVRFPAVSHIQDTAQHSSVAGSMYMNARKLHNLAGKYIGSWGTPFDLADLAGSPGLDLSRITHVRIVDVIGDIGTSGTRDANGRRINDPFPTPFPVGGFDLDAVGVIHAVPANVWAGTPNDDVLLYPNPAGGELFIILPEMNGRASLAILDVTGRTLLRQDAGSGRTRLSLSSLAPGSYFLSIRTENGPSCTRGFIHR